MAGTRVSLRDAVEADLVAYERRQTGDADLSRFYRYVWHVGDRQATPYETKLLDELAIAGDLQWDSFGVGPQTSRTWLAQ